MSKKILFIDDDINFLYLLNRVSRRIEGIAECLTAENGQEALDLLINLAEEKKDLPDLMFIDINMPVMDGFEFLSKFKDLHEKFELMRKIKPIIMLTSSKQNSDKKKALETNLVSEYIIKPAGVENIEVMLKEAII